MLVYCVLNSSRVSPKYKLEIKASSSFFYDAYHLTGCAFSFLKTEVADIFIKNKIMFETLSDKQITGVVSGNIIGRIGCHADGKTYVVPISYAYDGDYIYARSFEGLKIDMMRKNPEVCFQVDEMKNMADWKSVVIWGTFEELKEETDREKGLQILMSRILPKISSETVKLTPEWPFGDNDLTKIEGIVFRIQIKEMTGRLEKPEMDLYKNWVS